LINTMRAESVFNNLVNGNLAEFKIQMRNWTRKDVIDFIFFLIDEKGYDWKVALREVYSKI